MTKFVGQLSKADVNLLSHYAKEYPKILEFGAGGSTMIFAQTTPKKVLTMEPNPVWVARTLSNLSVLGADSSKYEIVPYSLKSIEGEYDLVFVDGTANERFPFALVAFKHLRVGGWILFHDTRERGDLRNFLELAFAYRDEVGHIFMNADGSNISGIQRKPSEPAYDWSVTEGQLPWQTGAEVPPANWPSLLE